MVDCQDKEEKERQMNSRAAVEETAEERANFNSIGVEEEIIELQVVVVLIYYESYTMSHNNILYYHSHQSSGPPDVADPESEEPAQGQVLQRAWR